MAEENKTNEGEVKNHTYVKTYADDMAGVIGGDQGGLVKKIIEEEEMKETEKIALSPETKQNKIFMILGVTFFVISISLLVYLFLQRGATTVNMEAVFTPMIFTDESAIIEVADMNKDKIVAAVWEEVNKTEVKKGGVEGVYLTDGGKLVGLSRLSQLVAGNFPIEHQSIMNDNFLLGIANGASLDVFFLIQVRSFTDIFDSMRAWESKMFYDLHGFLGTEISSATNHLLTKSFEDGFIENKNARILYNTDGTIALMYVFVDGTHVMISSSEGATKEVIFRLAGSRIAK